MIKSFKIRIYPTKEQEILIKKHIGSCRYMWNYMLALEEETYKNGGKHLNHFDMVNLLSPLKKDGEHEWLNEVSSHSLGLVCGDLDKAYKSFFKQISRHPKFKKKKNAKQNYPVRNNIYFVDEKYMKIEKLGRMKYKTDFVFPIGRDNKFSNVRISFINNKWVISFGMECENKVTVLNDFCVGIDLGVKEQAVVAYDDDKSIVYHNINKSKRVRDLEKRLKHEQRSLSRKYEQNNRTVTGNYERQKEVARRLYRKLANVRDNYIHQITHEIVELLPHRVVMEDLNVSGMMKNKYLSRSIAQQNFYKFISYMKYKCEWNGIEFVQVPRFYPSSKTCSNCGCVKSDLKLSDRTYVRQECGAIIDRDLNAAINLKNYAC